MIDHLPKNNLTLTNWQEATLGSQAVHTLTGADHMHKINYKGPLLSDNTKHLVSL